MEPGPILLRRLFFADEVADRDAVEVGDAREDIDVGQTLSALPLRDGFVGIIQLRRQIHLRILVRLAVRGDIL